MEELDNEKGQAAGSALRYFNSLFRPFRHLLHLRASRARSVQSRSGSSASKGHSLALGGVEGAGVVHQIGDLQGRQTVLAAPKEVAGTAGLEVVLRYGEAV